MYLSIFLFLVFVACFATIMNNGLWSNALSLINVVTSALLATNYFEPLADFLDKQAPDATYVWDFFSLWGIFGVAMLALRAATDFASTVKVRFIKQLDQAGGYLFAAWVGWIVVCFTTMTLHTAPLSRNFMGGAFQPNPDSKMFFGLAPDRLWLSWVRKESNGSLCRFEKYVPFDPLGDFILRYGARRMEFSQQTSLLKGKAAGEVPPQ